MNEPAKGVPTKAKFGEIALVLKGAIMAGEFPVGGFLPTELELCSLYQTSRHTIRAALSELQQWGLVSRKKNVGTRVIAAQPQSGFRLSLTSVDDLVQFGAEHLRVVQRIRSVQLESELANELHCRTGSRWLQISSLRLVDSQDPMPIGWTDVYVTPAYADIKADVEAAPDTLVSALIEKRYGCTISQIEQEVFATTIDTAEMVEQLKTAEGMAALKIVRRYFDDDGNVFVASVTIHPADRFSVSMKLSRSSQ